MHRVALPLASLRCYVRMKQIYRLAPLHAGLARATLVRSRPGPLEKVLVAHVPSQFSVTSKEGLRLHEWAHMCRYQRTLVESYLTGEEYVARINLSTLGSLRSARHFAGHAMRHPQ